MGHVYPTHDQPADTIEVGRRHRETFAQIPEWVALADIPPQALALYVRLHMHVNGARNDGIVWPGMDTLAAMMGYRRRQSVGPHLDALARIGALDVRRVKTPTGRRNVYVVHEVPRDDHAGPRSLAEFYREHHARRDEALADAEGGMCATAHVGKYATAHDPMCATPHMNQTKLNQTKRTTRSTPPGEDDCASSGRKRVSDPKLFKPNDLGQMTTGALSQHLTSTYVAAVEHVGANIDKDGPGAIGRWVHDAVEAGWDHERIWREFCALVDRAWSGERHPWLIASRPEGARGWAA